MIAMGCRRAFGFPLKVGHGDLRGDFDAARMSLPNLVCDMNGLALA